MCADSAFGVLKDDLTACPLYSLLKDAGVEQLFVCGLASDYSVQYTVLDAKMVLPETKVFVVEDACKGVTAAGIQVRTQCMQAWRTWGVRWWPVAV